MSTSRNAGVTTMASKFSFSAFLRAGHGPTLFAAFFYLTFSFVVWVINGVLAPFISEEFHLTPAQKGTMLAIPIVAGALMRFPLGVLAQFVGRAFGWPHHFTPVPLPDFYGARGLPASGGRAGSSRGPL